MGQSVRIKDLYLKEKPREKVTATGVHSLSNEEIVAIILGTGIKGKSVLDVSRELLVSTAGLSRLGKITLNELKAQSGIGTAKASQLLAAIELGKRLSSHVDERQVVSHSGMVYQVLKSFLKDLQQELFGLVILNTKNEIVRIEKIALGTLNATLVHPRDVFNAAISYHAASVILYHNHPSGNPDPSQEDVNLTNRLVEAGKLLGIPVLDHIIVGNPSYYSFKDAGKLLV